MLDNVVFGSCVCLYRESMKMKRRKNFSQKQTMTLTLLFTPLCYAEHQTSITSHSHSFATALQYLLHFLLLHLRILCYGSTIQQQMHKRRLSIIISITIAHNHVLSNSYVKKTHVFTCLSVRLYYRERGVKCISSI